jgi:hypothetical protein
MGARVIELLVNNPGTSYFFAFGAGHFVGENTVLDVVRNAGWKRTRSPWVGRDIFDLLNFVVLGIFFRGLQLLMLVSDVKSRFTVLALFNFVNLIGISVITINLPSLSL